MECNEIKISLQQNSHFRWMRIVARVQQIAQHHCCIFISERKWRYFVSVVVRLVCSIRYFSLSLIFSQRKNKDIICISYDAFIAITRKFNEWDKREGTVFHSMKWKRWISSFLGPVWNLHGTVAKNGMFWRILHQRQTNTIRTNEFREQQNKEYKIFERIVLNALKLPKANCMSMATNERNPCDRNVELRNGACDCHRFQ